MTVTKRQGVDGTVGPGYYVDYSLRVLRRKQLPFFFSLTSCVLSRFISRSHTNATDTDEEVVRTREFTGPGHRLLNSRMIT